MNTSCAGYQDFLGEAIAESYRTGKLRKPNTNGKLHNGRKVFREKMQKESDEQQRPIEDVALDYVDQNSGQIQKYILSKGEIPFDENPQALAMQAYELRKREVEDIAAALGTDLSTAEAYLDEAENNAMDINSPESDSFIGELFDAIAQTAAPAINKAAAKHQAKKGKPGAIGFISKLFGGGGQNISDVATGAADNTLDKIGEGKLGDIAKGILDKVTEDQKKKEIKKMLPGIIIGVVLLIVVVILLTKSFSKK